MPDLSTFTISLPDLSDLTFKGFDWLYKKKMIPEIRQIYFNRETGYTTIVWEDGSDATVVRCGDGETFEDYMGFCAAIVKKLFGSTSAAKKMMENKDSEKVKAKKEAARQKAAEETRAKEEANRARNERKAEALFRKSFGMIQKLMPQPNIEDLINGLFEKEEDDGK